MTTRLLVFSLVLCAFCSAAIGFPIKGTVVDTDGKPVPGIKVTALTYKSDYASWAGSVVRETVVTDTAGGFVLKTLEINPAVKRAPVGQVTLVAIQSGKLIGWRQLRLGYLVYEEQTAEFAKGIKIEVARPVTAEGKVTDGSGRPVAGAKVECESINAKAAKPRSFDFYATAKQLRPAIEYPPVYTDQNGVYRIANVPENVTPTVHVSKPAFAMKPIPYDARPSLDVVMVPGGSASGRLIDEKGVGQPGALVSMSGSPLSPTSSSGSGRSISGKDGSFVIDGLVPGEYRLTVRAIRDDHITLERRSIKVKAAETTKLPDIVSPPSAYVTGRVTDADTGKPIPGAEIGASSDQFRGPRVTSDKQGSFKIAVLPGDIRVYYSGGSPMYMMDWRANPKPVAVPAAGLRGYDIKLKCNGACKGTVVGPDGKPLANVTVSIGSRPDGVQTVTDTKGGFALGLPPNVDLSGG